MFGKVWWLFPLKSVTFTNEVDVKSIKYKTTMGNPNTPDAQRVVANSGNGVIKKLS